MLRYGLRLQATRCGGIGNGQVDDLGDLTTEGIVIGPEGAVDVARDRSVANGGFDEWIEHIVPGHVIKRGGCCTLQRPARADHDNLGQLAACYKVGWAKIGPMRAVTRFGDCGLRVGPAASVAADETMRYRRLHHLIEDIASIHIGEGAAGRGADQWDRVG